MDKKEITKLLNIGENQEVEFKTSKNKLLKSIWETYSSFCNSIGNITIDGIKWNISELKRKGILKREGNSRNGRRIILK